MSEDTEVIVVQPKRIRLNRAQRRAKQMAHRRQWCRHCCDLCSDHIPPYYFRIMLNPVRRKRREKRRVIVCEDCLEAIRDQQRKDFERWCATHTYKDRGDRLEEWLGIDSEKSPMAVVLEAMQAEGVTADAPPTDDESTEATCAMEMAVYRLTGEAGLMMGDDDWRVLHRSVIRCLLAREKAYQQAG